MDKRKTRIHAAILGSLAALNMYAFLHKSNDKVEPPVNNKDYYESMEPKVTFHYDNDTVNIDESIESLGLDNNDVMPYNTYKVFRIIDNSDYERIVITNSYITYLTDSNGNIENTLYTYVDAFDGTQLFTTFENKNDHVLSKIENYTSGVVKYIMDEGDLLDLKRIVIEKGLDSEYANSIMSDDIKNKSLSKYDVARMYVLLVNSKNRLEHSNMAIILK